MKNFPPEIYGLVQSAVIQYIEKHGKTKRKDLFAPALKVFNFTPEEKKDVSPEGSFGKAKSLSGIIINDMIKLNTLLYEDDFLVLNQSTKKMTKKDILEYFYGLYLTEEELKEKGPDTKKGVINSFIGNRIKQDPLILENSRENVLKRIEDEILKRKKLVELLLGKDEEANYPPTSIGNLLREHNEKYKHHKQGKIDAKEYKKNTISMVGQLFGKAEEFFENFVFALVTKMYGDSIISSHKTAGPDDEGVDCRFEVKDACGFKDKIMVQAKTKKAEMKNINIKVLREYIGVMILQKANKCIIISNTDFTKTARDAAKGYNSVLLIGLDELYDLMLQAQYGMKTDSDGVDYIDKEIFLV